MEGSLAKKEKKKVLKIVLYLLFDFWWILLDLLSL